MQGVGLCKRFGKVTALESVDIAIRRGEVTGLVGDNGAGKSTLIKILTGVYRPDEGELRFEGRKVEFASPKDARKLGIETVYQDLALIENMSIARNFFLGAEPQRRVGILRLLDAKSMRAVTEEALRDIGIRVRSANDEVSVLSGGERQAIAIGRTMHFGGKLLILDEPTSALSVHETNKVLSYIDEARKRGLAVIFITHNLYHVYPVADRIVVLEHGRKVGDFGKDEISVEELVQIVSFGARGMTPAKRQHEERQNDGGDDSGR
ncbi:MAG: ATP-binding cassette domain-containing protein [Firmicutes bacterium]|jgi:simple sugar transport system ATP-binding protein|nr:ATP-binding cassette domain-containing protein [Bacillota bacterium]MDH7494723.1 ATP-binding cassette domain-containing protein [Bacillota bacterium]